MDTPTIITAAILLAICLLPFILMRYNRKKNENELFQSLKNLAQNVQCTIDEYELCSGMMIGIDTTKNILFYIKKGNSDNDYKYVELNDFRQCELQKLMKTTPEFSIIEKLVLKFIPFNEKDGIELLELYDSNERFQLNGELQLGEKWFKIISDRMKR